MGKRSTGSVPQDWYDVMSKEAQRDIPQRAINAYLKILEEKGLVKVQDGYANPTNAFRKEFVRAIESLRTWYKPTPIDDPQGLIALEMSRLLLGVNHGRIARGLVSPQEVGGLSSVIAGILRNYFQEQDAKNLMSLILKSH